jgi:class 3 adenylate cyclase
VTEPLKSLPLPDNGVLAAAASALGEAGYSAWLLDASWRVVYVTDEALRQYASLGTTAVPIGAHYFSAEAVRFRMATFGGAYAVRESHRAFFSNLAPYVLASTPGGHDELRGVVDPDLADLVDGLRPQEIPVMWVVRSQVAARETSVAGSRHETSVMGSLLWMRIKDGRGQLAGLCFLVKPAAGMSLIAVMTAMADVGHLERMRAVARPDRRPAAILMADLEASSPLARRLSTAQYFAFGRHLLHAADECVVDAGGIVGRHAGDGVVALFLAETAGSETTAARSCITAARNLRDSLADVAARSAIPPSELSLRFGLHWGASLYVGGIATPGRTEVTALGDEMNEAARIEACATGGRPLASKALIERLNKSDANELGLDTDHMTYTPLADLSTATDKARRDAPTIAVCEV